MSRAQGVTEARMLLDGSKLKWTLERAAVDGPTPVRVDWLRFTVPLDAVAGRVEARDLTGLACLEQSERELIRQCRASDIAGMELPSVRASQAGARIVVEELGEGFGVGPSENRGMDYYTSRTEVQFAGVRVGYVLAGGKAANQASTVHVNLFGEAMLHVSHEKRARLRKLIDEAQGWITRCDLSLDVFKPKSLTLPGIVTAYLEGKFDVRGKRPQQRESGSWTSGHSRTFYCGARGSGKLFRGYEKHDEVFGHEAGAEPWIRLEVEFRNNCRVIDTAALTECGAYFAGAYPFLAEQLEEATAESVIPAATQCDQRLQDKTAEGAATRVATWMRDTVGPSLVALFDMGGDLLADIVTDQRHRKARRLAGFSASELSVAFAKVAGAFAPAPVPSMNGA